MGSFDYLFQDQAPAAVNTTSVAGSSGPDWYNNYIQGIAGKGLELAGNAASQPIPQQQIAGFTPDQTQAFQQIRDNQGAWRPALGAAGSLIQGAAGTATNAAGAANAAVAGPSANWTDPGTANKYMSPYTSSVVNEIARLGNQNFNETVMPGVNASMIGSGQFGSQRNADVLGRAARDTQQNITGQQASALESGYSTAGNLMNQDANRAQQQQSTQASTALQGGQLASGTQMTAGTNTGALGQATAALGMTDAQALQASGQQQQQLNQTGLDTSYNNTVANNNAGWSNLNNLSTIVRGAQLPTTQTAINNGPLSRAYTPSPLSTFGTTVGAALGR